MALAERTPERKLVFGISEPGRYGFEFSGSSRSLDVEIQGFLKENFPRISAVRFYPAHLTNFGDYVPAAIDEIPDWKRMGWDQKHIVWENMMGEKEYYSIVASGSYSGGSGGWSISIEDTGKLSIGRNKLKAEIGEAGERDGKISVSWHGTAPHHSTDMNNGHWNGFVNYEGKKPGSLVRATRSFVEKMAADGIPLWKA